MEREAAVRVKICGITSPEDALVAVEAGADLIGMVFYPPSPRHVSPETARRIVEAVRASGRPVRVVGVTVNAPDWLLRFLLEELRVDWVQCHGDESPSRVRRLAGRAFKAVRLPGPPRDALAAYAALGPADGPRLLVDAAVPGAYGGTGQLTDWDQARALAREMPLLLAGGLTPENVASAVRHVRPWGVDVSGGVEASPGRKDPARVRAFVEQARLALEVST